MTLVEIQRTELLSPSGWIERADALFDSAAQFDPLVRKYWEREGQERKNHERFLKTNLMLAAFAMENLLKALIVQDQRKTLEHDFAEKRELPTILRTHDLCRLAERARVTLGDDRTRKLLDRLTRHSVWAGRYPVPLRPEDLPAEDVLKLGNDWLPIDCYFTSDWRDIQTLYGRAKQILERRGKAPTTESNATSEPAPSAVSEAVHS